MSSPFFISHLYNDSIETKVLIWYFQLIQKQETTKILPRCGGVHTFIKFWFTFAGSKFQMFQIGSNICFYPCNLQLKYKLQYLDPREMELIQNIKQTIFSESGHALQVPFLRVRCSMSWLPQVLVLRLRVESFRRIVLKAIPSRSINLFPEQTHMKLLVSVGVKRPDFSYIEGRISYKIGCVFCTSFFIVQYSCSAKYCFYHSLKGII